MLKAIFAFPFPQDVNASNEDKRIDAVQFYDNADTGCYIHLPPISPLPLKNVMNEIQSQIFARHRINPYHLIHARVLEMSFLLLPVTEFSLPKRMPCSAPCRRCGRVLPRQADAKFSTESPFLTS